MGTLGRRFDDGPASGTGYAPRARRYEDLDAYKACHQLTLRVHRVVEAMEARDPALATALWTAALRAPTRIARSTAFSRPRAVAMCLDRTLGALTELAYHLSLARVMGLVSDDDHREIESLRGRAVFYTIKLLMSLFPAPDQGDGAPDSEE